MNGRIAITLSPKGIDGISFLSSDRQAALNFYFLIQRELDVLEERIRVLIENHREADDATEC